MSIFDGKELQALIENEMNGTDDVFFVSAYITEPAIKWLELHVPKQAIVSIVFRGEVKDFLGGATTISALRKIVSNGWRLAFNEKLHAKIYMFDRKVIFVGSSNLTNNGLVLSSHGNIEANSMVNADRKSLQFLDALWNSAVELSAEKLDQLENYLDCIEVEKQIDSYDQLVWPEELLAEPVGQLFVEDFPANSVFKNKEFKNKYSLIDSFLERDDVEMAKSIFMSLRLTKWFFMSLETHKALRFGQLSKLMHADLVEDPRVYRRDLKIMQANFLEYVERLVPEVEVIRPNHTSIYSFRRDFNP